MPPKNRFVETGIIRFSLNLLLSVLLALILLILTADGWIGLGILLIGIPLYFVFLFVLLLMAYGIKLFAYKSIVTIDKYLVFTILYTQIFLTIFNFGDCTSNTNHIDTNFIQRAMVTGFDCKDHSIKPWIPQEIILGIYSLNLILLAVFIIRTLASAHSKSV